MKYARFLILTLATIFAGLVLGEAQITIPYSFTPGTNIVSSQVNSNFSTVGTNALNRTGGSMTGTLTTVGVQPSADNTYDLGLSGTTYRNLFLKGAASMATATITGATTLNGQALTWPSGAGSSGNFLSTNGSGTLSWSAVSTPVVGYAATLANVLNTASETLILSFDVPANDWADGDFICIETFSLDKNNKGSDGTITAKLNVGAGAQVTIGSSAVFTNAATEYPEARLLVLQRIGAAVYVLAANGSGSSPFAASWNTNAGASNIAAPGSSTPANFTSTNTVSLKITLSAADATFYIKPQAARVWRQKAS